jgi:biopolymer transport protein ExbD
MFFLLWNILQKPSQHKPTFMAEMQTRESGHKKRGGLRSKKLSTRVDLTPMVDLGFLLITFFIFTTTLNEPKAMKMFLPMDGDGGITVSEEKVITLIPSADNKVFYYFGKQPETMLVTNFSAEGLRKIIISKKKQVATQFGDGEQTMVLIKPTDESSYQNLIDVLDEMLINKITRYMLLDPSMEENQLIAKR